MGRDALVAGADEDGAGPVSAVGDVGVVTAFGGEGPIHGISTATGGAGSVALLADVSEGCSKAGGAEALF